MAILRYVILSVLFSAVRAGQLSGFSSILDAAATIASQQGASNGAAAEFFRIALAGVYSNTRFNVFVYNKIPSQGTPTATAGPAHGALTGTSPALCDLSEDIPSFFYGASCVRNVGDDREVMVFLYHISEPVMNQFSVAKRQDFVNKAKAVVLSVEQAHDPKRPVDLTALAQSIEDCLYRTPGVLKLRGLLVVRKDGLGRDIESGNFYKLTMKFTLSLAQHPTETRLDVGVYIFANYWQCLGMD